MTSSGRNAARACAVSVPTRPSTTSRNRSGDAAVRALTGGHGVDLTVEVGGATTIDRSVAATRRGGRVALVGLLTGVPATRFHPCFRRCAQHQPGHGRQPR